MKTVSQYVRNEWKNWLATFFFIVVWASINHAAEAAPMPKSVLKARAGEVLFWQDKGVNNWYAQYGNHFTNMEETFDDVKVLWQGQYQGKPVVLISGQSGNFCEMAFRLYWFKAVRDVKQATNFGTCYAERIKVEIKNGMAHVSFDGVVKHVPLQ